MKYKVFKSVTYNKNVADYIAQQIHSVTKNRSRCTVALSGGSTPKAVYQLLGSSPLVDTIEWNLVDFLLGDERFVPLDDPRSNYCMAKQALAQSLSHSLHLYPIDISADSISAAAKNYATVVAEKVSIKTAHGIPVIDIMLLGIGDDGHTASLFPQDIPAIDADGLLCVGVMHPSDGTQRVTMTKSLIQASDQIVYMVQGSGKADILKEVIEGTASIYTYPSRLFTEVPDKVTFLIDEHAAKNLTVSEIEYA